MSPCTLFVGLDWVRFDADRFYSVEFIWDNAKSRGDFGVFFYGAFDLFLVGLLIGLVLRPSFIVISNMKIAHKWICYIV